IGMVSEPELIHKIVEKLQQYNAQNIVVDPVMVSTSGSRLLADRALTALKEELLPLAVIITPNIPEAEVLSDLSIHSKDDMISAAKVIATFFDGYILIKGGHFEDRADDLLYHNGNAFWLPSERIDNPNSHGTGCTLSSAIASNLALGYNVHKSVALAKGFIGGALRDGLDLGKGSGPLNHCWNM
ncbi:MAG: bifunctional hydroxymethylpyrimidine kinase/phosphomethylpyrimidine kinase, partial [Longicatena sp.]